MYKRQKCALVCASVRTYWCIARLKARPAKQQQQPHNHQEIVEGETSKSYIGLKPTGLGNSVSPKSVNSIYTTFFFSTTRI